MDATEIWLWLSVAVLTLLLVALSAALIFACHRLYCSVAPVWLIPAGEYAKARRCYEITQRSIPGRWLESNRDVTAYGIAICDHFLGDQEKALVSLRALPYDRLARPIQYGVDIAIGSTLLLLGRELAGAREHLARARAVIDAPDLALGAAIASRMLGEEGEVARCVADADALPVDGLVRGSMKAWVRRDREMVRWSTALSRGWLLSLGGEHERARPYLLEAASSPHPLTRKKALELLDRPPAGDDEGPPSSLKPVAR